MRPATLLAAAALLIAALPARAHEPLWGESPQTFAFGVWHPELRFGFQDEHLLLRGDRRIDDPLGLRRTRLDTVLGLQYAPRTNLNLRIEIPYSGVRSYRRVAGRTESAGVSGLGDAVISVKSRFRQRFGPDWKEHIAYTLGVQLPTGAHGGRDADGSPLSPSEQPGSGKWGYAIGCSYAFERLTDTWWASVALTGDLGGAGSKGEMAGADIDYGYWVIRAHRPQDPGIVLAAGPHMEWMAKDRIAGGADPNSGYTLAAIQVSAISTKGPAQLRLGALLPVYQHANGAQLRPEIQLRAGIEALF